LLAIFVFKNSIRGKYMDCDYLEKLRDPRWQRKRLHIFERDQWTCQGCGKIDQPLNVHHKLYIDGKEPWETDDKYLITLCDECHALETDKRDLIESILLKTLRIKFTLKDLATITAGFYHLNIINDSHLISKVIRYALTTPTLTTELINRYTSTT
jgi:hypothetical protein